MFIPRTVSRRKSAACEGLPSLATIKDVLAKQAAVSWPEPAAGSYLISCHASSSNATQMLGMTLHQSEPIFTDGQTGQEKGARQEKETKPESWGRTTRDSFEPKDPAGSQIQLLMEGPTHDDTRTVELTASHMSTDHDPVYGPTRPARAALAISSRLQHAPYMNSRIAASITGYQDSAKMAAMSSKDVRKLRDSLNVHIEGKHIPRPITSFEDCSLPAKMLSNLKDNGYIHPRGIQIQAIPTGLYGRDMIISAETGSGKTAGFLIPILTHAYGLSQSPTGAMQGPFALILAPTRELAMQVEEVVKLMVKGMPNMRSALLIGGQAMANQVHRLKQNIQVAVATPGRMVEIVAKHPEIGFSNIFCLVLDEVDVMFSVGFGKQVKRILEILPEPPNGRQTIVCSATLSKQIQRLTTKYLENALSIRIGNVNEPKRVGQPGDTNIADVFSPSSKIKQTIMWVENNSKKNQLFSLLKDPAYFRPPVLVFVESRMGADLLAMAVKTKCPGITTVSVHGEKSQEERSAILKSIVDGEVSVVVATGLLARGLNLSVATVINFDMAPSIQEYVHRVGRASPEAATKAAASIRKGPKLGGMAWAITFINNDHRPILSEFANMLHGLGFGHVTPLPAQLKQLVMADAKPAPPAPTSRSEPNSKPSSRVPSSSGKRKTAHGAHGAVPRIDKRQRKT
ncbi:DEAD (Asp-Glu-Ala-Asp) box polypeptide 59 [Mortierella sp. GBA30]|nr:DEAD (Asp-Glu-Ala-Asp) box polypeptide 59 [Mortierella sp. GBA30]